MEYQPLVRGKDLDEEKFDAISELAKDMDRSGAKLLDYSFSGGEIALVPKNYVGVVAFGDGEYLEILPKITDLDDPASIARVKEVFLKMLLTVLELDPEETGMTELDNWRNSPYEFFIRMFLSEVGSIVRKGIRSGYSDTEGNEPFVKGRILFAEDIRYNCSHRERTYQSFQVFDTDRAENRLIRATLRYLRTVSSEYGNRREIRRLLPYFDGCSEIEGVDMELRRCVSDRNMKHYGKAIKWCDIFLHNQTFSTFSGSDVAYTFLFPMEKVFESYVAKTLEANLVDFDVSVQNREKTLFDTGLVRQVRPDIVLKHNSKTIVLDTKWKTIGSNENITDDDLRQMKEYSKDFGGPAVLLYPKVTFDEEIESRREEIVVRTRFIDLLNDFDGWWEPFQSIL